MYLNINKKDHLYIASMIDIGKGKKRISMSQPGATIPCALNNLKKHAKNTEYQINEIEGYNPDREPDIIPDDGIYLHMCGIIKKMIECSDILYWYADTRHLSNIRYDIKTKIFDGVYINRKNNTILFGNSRYDPRHQEFEDYDEDISRRYIIINDDSGKITSQDEIDDNYYLYKPEKRLSRKNTIIDTKFSILGGRKSYWRVIQ